MNDCQTGLLHVKHLTDKLKREEGEKKQNIEI